MPDSQTDRTANPQLDAVLPLTAADAPRAALLFRSLEAFFEPLGTCWVVAPDADVAPLRGRVPPWARVVPESRVVPELGWFRATSRLRARLRLAGPPFHGWYVQQLVKLAAGARLVETPFLLTLDADVLCVRPTTYDDLVPDGRALLQSSPPNHPEWNDDAERVLGLPRSGRQWAVTPAVLSRDALRELARHLERRADPRLRRLAERLPPGRPREVAASWRARLLRALPWTEYALYGTFVERTGLLERYHVLAGEDAIYANCVWMESQFDDWDPRGGVAPFTLVQSATRLPPERVAERLERCLAAAAAGGPRP